MISCFFVSDLHGHPDRYEKFFRLIREGKPMAVFLGGDLLPHRLRPLHFRGGVINHFSTEFLMPQFERLRMEMGEDFPAVFLIMGNDDPRSEEIYFVRGEADLLWRYIHFRKVTFLSYTLFGYSYVPPTPFHLKDWERYDISRFVDPGSIPPTEGFRTVEEKEDVEHSTIRKHLEILTKGEDIERAVFLFHSPPYDTDLDMAALDEQMVEHVPLDVHVGSIAIREFIETRQPLLTMHGHIHESSRLTGSWKQRIGRTVAFNASWDSPDLAVIKFDLERPGDAVRVLI
ncbi:MAG: metallophosphoesterase [Bacteroidales bacterium]|nr:metallophosphoesterase [Lentimicrobiaceae bacterium]MDD5694010.1 metallophosphoesterase [Bacteroidales bacterium]